MGLSEDVLKELDSGRDSLDSIAHVLNRSKKSIVNATQVLKKRKLISGVTRFSNNVDCFIPGKYIITELGRQWIAQGLRVSPGQGCRCKVQTSGLAEKVWWQLRNYKIVTVRDILLSHTVTAERSSYIRVLKYLHALELAEIICRASRKLPVHQSCGMIQWHLVRDLGPKTPMWRQKSKCLYDPNSDSTFSV